MATADEYAAWIVKNAAKKGTPEFDTVAQAYQLAKQGDELSAPVNKPPATRNPLVDQIPGSSVKAPASTAAPAQIQAVAPRAPGFLAPLGRSVASLADVTVGGVLPAIAQQVAYPLARLSRSPQEAQAATARVVGAVDQPFGKAFGVSDTPEYQEEYGRQVLDFIGQNVQKGAKWIAGKTGLAQSDIENYLGTAAVAAPKVAPTVGRVAREAAAPAIEQATIAAKMSFEEPLRARAARIQEANVAKSYANAPMIDAAQAVRRIGGVVPPAISNPTKANVIKGKLVGPELEQQFAKNNETAVTDRVRKDLGVKPNEKLIPEIDDTGNLNTNSPITRALDEASKPYDVIRQMKALTTPKESIDALTALKRTAPIGGGTKTAAINGLIDDALTKLQTTTSGPFSGVGGGPVQVGRSGSAVLDDIRSLRRDAQATYRAQKINPDPLATAKADTQMAIAGILEDVIDANAPNPKVLNDLRAARTRMAQIYEHERAINYGQQKIDPQVYAKLYEERKGGMTGLNADIAQAASMFPDYFTLAPAEIKGLPRITRGGVGGAIGGAIGAPLGLPGILAGTALGMGVGGAASGLAARRMASPGYQAANAMPRDYRPVPSGLRPVEPNAPVNALASYDYTQQSFTPPNFVLRSGQEAPVYTPPSYPQLTQFGDFETTANALRNQEARAGARSRTAGQQAEAQQAAAEAAARQPARGGTVVELDPVTGRLVPVDTTLRGATPNIQIIESTGKSLSGAADILLSGKSPALMSAEQRIAWEKTKVDLADVVPGMKTLTDKAVAAKMQDRAWVQDAITKAQDRARAFQDIAARANNERLRQDALMKREQMLDLVEGLEEQFRKARPVKTGGQGPKTREFQRKKLNMLSDQDVVNELLNR